MSIQYIPSDLKCPCGCGLEPEQEAVDALNQLIIDVGFPLHVSSGARCRNYNKSKGFKEISNHTLGIAFDIACELPSKRYILCGEIIDAGIFSLEDCNLHFHINYLPEKMGNQIMVWGVSK